MPEYDNTNRGVLFRNEKKSNDKQPDYTGSINIDGTEHSLAAWIRESKNGKKFMSLSRSEPRPRDDEVTDVGSGPIDLSDVPF